MSVREVLVILEGACHNVMRWGLVLSVLLMLHACGMDEEEGPVTPRQTCDVDCNAQGQFCDPQQGVCVACLFSNNCDAGQMCDQGMCVDAADATSTTRCTDDSDCLGQSRTICSDMQRCEWQCRTAMDCSDSAAMCTDNLCVSP